MNVLIIPEDFRKDQYMLKPIVEAMLAYLGRRTSKVSVLTDPLLGGIDQALNHDQIRKIVKRYQPIAKQRGLLAEPGEGRKTLGLEAAQRYGQRLRRKCAEDLQALETRIGQAIGGG